MGIEVNTGAVCPAIGKSGGGPPHSQTLARGTNARRTRRVWECGGRAGAATLLSGGREVSDFKKGFRAGESGVALRFPPQSKTRVDYSRALGKCRVSGPAMGTTA